MLHHFTKDNKIQRLAGGGETIEQVTDTNKHLSETEDNINSFSKLANFSDIDNVLNSNKSAISYNKINNNTVLIDFQNQEYHIRSIKNIAVKQCDTAVNISSTSSFDQKIYHQYDQDILGYKNLLIFNLYSKIQCMNSFTKLYFFIF
jgi:hypothetical protein